MAISDNAKRMAQLECDNFLSGQVGALAVVIATADGFDLASGVSKGLDAARIAAMASSIAAIGSVVSQETLLGNSKSVTVNTENGFAYIAYLDIENNACILNVIADSSAILAQVIYNSGEIRKRLSAL